ncbi:hypothetical protein HDU98_004972 [Podochytrium sp. JEL0797]|nr:hypothetical protein HDU98_004972 [Podochytrium sp. JEL0797]
MGMLLRRKSLKTATGESVSGRNVEEESEGLVVRGGNGTLGRTRSFKESHVMITAVVVGEDPVGVAEEVVKEEVKGVTVTVEEVMDPVVGSLSRGPSRQSSWNAEEGGEGARRESLGSVVEETEEEVGGAVLALEMRYSPVPILRGSLDVRGGEREEVVEEECLMIEAEKRGEDLEGVSVVVEEVVQDNGTGLLWPSYMISEEREQQEIAPAVETEEVMGDTQGDFTMDQSMLMVPDNEMDQRRASLSENDNEFAYPGEDQRVQGFPRFPLHIEKEIYQHSHQKLAQPRRPLIQQVMISNLMLYILSVHADVTLHRQGPRKKKGSNGRKKRNTSTSPSSSKKKRSNRKSHDPEPLVLAKSVQPTPPIAPLILLTPPTKKPAVPVEKQSILSSLEEYAERRERSRRKGGSSSDTASLSSVGSDSSWTSVAEDAAGSVSGGGGGGFFGKKKGKVGNLLSRIMGRPGGVVAGGEEGKKVALDDDDVPLAFTVR